MDWAWPLRSRIVLLASQRRSQTTDTGEQGLLAGAPEALLSAKGVIKIISLDPRALSPSDSYRNMISS